MKTTLLILSLVIISGCATTHDSQIQDERRSYKKECDQWQKDHGDRLTVRKTGEEYLPLQEVMAARCKENPEDCTPPTIPVQLRNDEYMWGVYDPTPDMCNLSNIPKRKGYNYAN
jgi:hypothetical protein